MEFHGYKKASFVKEFYYYYYYYYSILRDRHEL